MYSKKNSKFYSIITKKSMLKLISWFVNYSKKSNT